MPKIERKHQKIFAGEANNNGVFGSAQQGAKQVSNDLDKIQSLPSFLQGWLSATISGKKLPTLEEMQGLEYMNTSQLAYLFQEGIPEWNAQTTYYRGSIVKVTEPDVDPKFYQSIIDDNTQAISEKSAWKEALAGAIEIVYTE